MIKMNISLDYIAKGKCGCADDSEFTVLDSYSLDNSTVDGLAYDNRIAIMTNQYNDHVLVFNVNMTAKMPLTLRGQNTGT
jgi:hypothetical protein